MPVAGGQTMATVTRLSDEITLPYPRCVIQVPCSHVFVPMANGSPPLNKHEIIEVRPAI